MESKLKIPTFANEGEEAEWWYQNRESLSDEFEKAGREGKLRVGSVVRRALAADGVVKLPEADLAKAKLLAEREGVPYEEYVQQLIHEALEQKTAA